MVKIFGPRHNMSGHMPRVQLGPKIWLRPGILIHVDSQCNVSNGLILNNMAVVSGIIVLKLWKYLGRSRGSRVTCRGRYLVENTGRGLGILIKVDLQRNVLNHLVLNHMAAVSKIIPIKSYKYLGCNTEYRVTCRNAAGHIGSHQLAQLWAKNYDFGIVRKLSNRKIQSYNLKRQGPVRICVYYK
jgi:hypothetical protein